MKKHALLTLLTISLSAILLAGCAGTSQRLLYNATNAEQMKKADLVGHFVEYCPKGKQCPYGSASYFLVDKQDETSISSANGEKVLYADIQYLSYAASKSDEIKNDLMQTFLLPAMLVCSIFSNGCWR